MAVVEPLESDATRGVSSSGAGAGSDTEAETETEIELSAARYLAGKRSGGGGGRKSWEEHEGGDRSVGQY